MTFIEKSLNSPNNFNMSIPTHQLQPKQNFKIVFWPCYWRCHRTRKKKQKIKWFVIESVARRRRTYGFTRIISIWKSFEIQSHPMNGNSNERLCFTHQRFYLQHVDFIQIFTSNVISSRAFANQMNTQYKCDWE